MQSGNQTKATVGPGLYVEAGRHELGSALEGQRLTAPHVARDRNQACRRP